jgi:hypothetical protein
MCPEHVCAYHGGGLEVAPPDKAAELLMVHEQTLTAHIRRWGSFFRAYLFDFIQGYPR